MAFRFLQRILPSAHTQRRLGRIGGTVFKWIGYPFGLIFRLGSQIGSVIASWWESRNLRYLLQGLPALVLAIGLLVVGAMVFFQDRSALAQDYQAAGTRTLFDANQLARMGRDPKAAVAAAQTCYKRLSLLQMDIQVNTAESTFHMAETYVLQRQPQAAENIFLALAPLDPKKPGYGPAHFEVARRLLASPSAKSEERPQQIDNAYNHLMRAVAYGTEPYSSFACAMLFDLLKARNYPDEAERYLETAVKKIGDQYPEQRINLARWYMQNQKRDLAEKQIDAAIVALEKKLEENIDDNRSRGMLITCLLLAGQSKCARGDFIKGNADFVRAKSLCDSGRALALDASVQNQYLSMRSGLLMAQFDSLERDPNKVPSEQYALLEQAMYLNPADMKVLTKLVAYIRLTGPEGDRVRKMFDDLLASGTNSVVAHIVLGADAYAHDDFVGAKYHWEKACDKTNGAPWVANNLAWLLAMKISPPDYPRALELIDTAIRQADATEYHSTRGQILNRMKRYPEALPELEKAKQAYANNPALSVQLFEALAETCENLDMKSDAKGYRERAKRAAELAKPKAAAAPAAPGAPPPADSKAPVAGSVTAPKP